MNTLCRNVLVVDDEDGVRRSYARSLEAAGCKVEAVRDGIDALRALERRAFDLVMLDLRLPGIDGMAVLRTIKEKWPEGEVVVITGYPSIESAKEAIRLGACDYLAKPVGPDDVINAATRALLHKEWALRPDETEPAHSRLYRNVARAEHRCAA
jgi:DNA-binding NtrC family response regulator